jgi:SAM-dependent methyltransferase
MTFQEQMVDVLAGQVDISGKSVLELGAGPDFLSARAFKARGAVTIVCSDLSDVWYGNTEPGVVTAVIDARYADKIVPQRSIDIVYGINVLEHFPDIPLIMESLARVVRPGGIVLLHGHPLWTSSRGHHVLLGDPEHWVVNFQEDSNPIPLWGHLVLSEEQLRESLKNYDEAIQVAAIEWCFRSDQITRTPRRQIIHDVTNGPFKLRAMWEDQGENPDGSITELIRQTRWWDPEEDYSVRQITIVLEAK